MRALDSKGAAVLDDAVFACTIYNRLFCHASDVSDLRWHPVIIGTKYDYEYDMY